MKKVFSFVAVALLSVTILFTACRETTTVKEGPEVEVTPAPQAAPAAPDATAPAPDSTGAQQAQ